MAEHDTNSRPGISRARLAHIAAWSIDLPGDEADRACAGIVEKTYARGACICPKNTLLESWTGVVTGLIKIGTVSPEGRSITFTGVPAGGWFGEGTVLKNEPRRYDIVALRDTRMAFMERATFMWLVENSVAFNRFLVKQPERQFFVPAADVCYLEATSSGVLLHLTGTAHPLRATLAQLAERLDPAHFLRIHRSVIIHTEHIVEFKPWAHGEYVFRMANGLHVTSSRSYNAAIQQFLKRFA